MISHEHRCIFVHIPKCGGTSIEKTLGYHRDGLRRSGQDHRRLVTLQRAIWPPVWGVYRPREFVRYVNQQRFAKTRGYEIASREQFEQYFKFAIVRNPWDRAHSWYRNVIRDPIHRKDFGVDERCTFIDFMREHSECWALDPQLDWLTDRQGRFIADFVGRFETLSESYAEARRRLGLDPVELPQLIHTDPVDYRIDYTDELRQAVAGKYAEEIERFGYEF